MAASAQRRLRQWLVSDPNACGGYWWASRPVRTGFATQHFPYLAPVETVSFHALRTPLSGARRSTHQKPSGAARVLNGLDASGCAKRGTSLNTIL